MVRMVGFSLDCGPGVILVKVWTGKNSPVLLLKL